MKTPVEEVEQSMQVCGDHQVITVINPNLETRTDLESRGWKQDYASHRMSGSFYVYVRYIDCSGLAR